LTLKVSRDNVCNTMNGLSSITQKGQVVIPKPIREYLGLKPSDKIYFEVKDDQIIGKAVISIDEAYGMINTGKTYSRKEQKEAIEEETLEKLKRKQDEESKKKSLS